MINFRKLKRGRVYYFNDGSNNYGEFRASAGRVLIFRPLGSYTGEKDRFGFVTIKVQEGKEYFKEKEKPGI